MSLLLINPPVARYDYAELAPPLGLLQVARTARRIGKDVQVLDLNLPVHRKSADNPNTFTQYVLEKVASFDVAEVGITSMGINSHLALALARDINADLGADVTLGGVHFGSICNEIIERFPWVKRVATPRLRSHEGCGQWWGESNDPSLLGLRSLYSAVRLDDYFDANSRRVANLELGRGCKYRCSFCYSPFLHGGWESPDISSAVRAFGQLYELGFGHAFVVNDNLVNRPEWLRSLAGALSEEQIPMTWNGYATLPDLDPGIFELLARSGCVDLYIGVDAVEDAQQKAWKKRHYRDSAGLRALLAEAMRCGLGITCAFILDLRDESEMATWKTMECAQELSACGAEIRLSVFAKYPGTQAYDGDELCVYDETRALLLADVPLAVVQNEFAPERPALFPWHCRPWVCSEWGVRVCAVLAAQVLLNDGVDVGCGRELWQACISIAKRMQSVEGVHKTELKVLIRQIAAEDTIW